MASLGPPGTSVGAGSSCRRASPLYPALSASRRPGRTPIPVYAVAAAGIDYAILHRVVAVYLPPKLAVELLELIPLSTRDLEMNDRDP